MTNSTNLVAQRWAEFRASIEPELAAKRPKEFSDKHPPRTKEETRYVVREYGREAQFRKRWIGKVKRKVRRILN